MKTGVLRAAKKDFTKFGKLLIALIDAGYIFPLNPVYAMEDRDSMKLVVPAGRDMTQKDFYNEMIRPMQAIYASVEAYVADNRHRNPLFTFFDLFVEYVKTKALAVKESRVRVHDQDLAMESELMTLCDEWKLLFPEHTVFNGPCKTIKWTLSSDQVQESGDNVF